MDLYTVRVIGQFPAMIADDDEWDDLIEGIVPFTLRFRKDPQYGVVTLIETSDAGARELIAKYGAVKIDKRSVPDEAVV